MRAWNRLICVVAVVAMAGPAFAGAGEFDDHDDDSHGQPFIGSVRDRSGSPLSGAKVTVSVPKQKTSLVVRTDGQGAFHIRGFEKSISPDEVEFACAMDGYAPFAQARAPAPGANGGIDVTCILSKP
jgi:hypothetical protein